MFSTEKNYMKEQKVIIENLKDTIENKDEEIVNLKDRIDSLQEELVQVEEKGYNEDDSFIVGDDDKGKDARLEHSDEDESTLQTDDNINLSDVVESAIISDDKTDANEKKDDSDDNISLSDIGNGLSYETLDANETDDDDGNIALSNLEADELGLYDDNLPDEALYLKTDAFVEDKGVLPTDIYKLYIPKNIQQSLKELNPNDYYKGRSKFISFFSIRFVNLLSGKLSPYAYIKLYNKIFNQLSSVIYSHGGFISSYSGESIDVAFGLFEDDGPSVSKSVLDCYKGVRNKLKIINDYLGSKNITALKTTVIIHSGEAIVGAVASKDNILLTGDEVKAVNAIAGLAYSFDYSLICSFSVYNAMSTSLSLEKIKDLHLEGLERTIKLFAL